MHKLRTVFMGTPNFSIPSLKILIENTEVILVVTQPDKIIGRKKILTTSPVKNLAIQNGIEVFQPNKISLNYNKIVNLKPDLIITCAYGQILPKELLESAKYGSVNIHASLLPKYRGSAPINWAVINGEKKTGITLMYMDEGMDTGNIIDTVETKINAEDTYGTIYNRLSFMGADLLLKNLDYLQSSDIKSVKQGKEYTLAPMISREDEKLDFNLPGERIINKIRGLNPQPYAYTLIKNEEIKIITAKFIQKRNAVAGKIMEINKENLGIGCCDGIIYLLMVKPFGKKSMDIKSYLNGVNKDILLNSLVK